MGKRYRNATLWQAVHSTINALGGSLAYSIGRRLRRPAVLSDRIPAWRPLEPLETRMMLAVNPSISGPTTIEAGVTYNLQLTYTGDEPNSWVVYWGDGASNSYMGSTSPLTETHTFAFNTSNTPYQISATATESSTVYSADNVLVSTFGSLGVVQTQDIAGANAVSVIAGGNILVAGDGLAEYTSTGTLVQSFGDEGTVTFTGGFTAYSMAVLSDGDILVAGGTTGSSGQIGALVEYNSSGTLAGSFGNQGMVVTDNFGPGYAISVLPNWDILVAGSGTAPDDNPGIGAEEFYPDGSLVTSFGADGIAVTDAQGANYAYAMSVLPSNGNILLAGQAGTGMALAEFNSTGTLVTTFGTSGVVVTTSDGAEAANAMTVLSNGHILLAGSGGSSFNGFTLAEFDSTGTLVSSFGTAGLVTTDVGGAGYGYENAIATSILPNGEILVAGAGNFEFALAEYDSTGSLESSFGSGGTIIANLGPDDASANGLVVLPSGNILAVGQYNYDSVVLAEYSGDLVAVTPAPPVSTITGNSTADVGITYTLDLAPNYPSIDAGYNGITSWQVNWGDGTSADPDIQTISGNPSDITHTYVGAPGDYTINASATDPYGTYTAPTACTVQVISGPAVTSFQANNTGTLHTLTVNFSEAVTLPAGSLTLLEISNNSGTLPSIAATAQSGSASYVLTFSSTLSSGDYDLTVPAEAPMDAVGGFMTGDQTFAFNCQSGTLAAGLGPFGPTVIIDKIPLVVAGSTFTISAQAASQGVPLAELTYQWTVLDGTSAVTLTNSTSPDLTFAPSAAGTYSVKLDVTDPTTSSTTAPVPFIVTASTAQPPQIGGPAAIGRDQAATYTVSGSGASSATWTVTLGASTYATGTGSTFSFTPENTGDYVVEVSTTNASLTQTSTADLTVAYAPPTVSISGSPIGFAYRVLIFSSTVTQAAGVDDPLTYQWVVLNSSNTTVDVDATSTLSTFTVPGLTSAGTYTIQLTVGDGHDNTSAPVIQSFTIAILSDPLDDNFDFGTAAAGIPSTFGGDSDNQIFVNAVAQQADGKIVIAGIMGIIGVSGTTDLGPFIARFNSDLTIDTSFGPDHTGISYITLGALLDLSPLFFEGAAWPTAVAINPINQDIIVGGDAFSTDGNTIYGYNLTPAVSEYLSVPRIVNGILLPAGSVDPSFNGGNVQTPVALQSPSWEGGVITLKALSDGSILVGGFQSDIEINSSPDTEDGDPFTVTSDFLLFKLTSTGAFDSTFNSNGIAEDPTVDGDDEAAFPPFSVSDTAAYVPGYWAGIYSIAIQNGEILVGGMASREPYGVSDGIAEGFSQIGFMLTRYYSTSSDGHTAGTVDTSFGTDGETFTSDSGAFDSGTDVDVAYFGSLEVLPDGNILATGWANYSQWNGSYYDDTSRIVFAQYAADGTFDSSVMTSLTTDGYWGEVFNLGSIQANGPVFGFETDGSIIVSTPQIVGGVYFYQAIVHIYTDGSIDTSFGDGTSTDGEVVTDQGGLQPQYMPNTLLVTNAGIVTVGIFILDKSEAGFENGESEEGDDGWAYEPMVLRYNYVPTPTPSDLTASATSAGPINLTWSQAGYAVEGYEIDRATTLGGLSSPNALLATVLPGQTTYTDTNVTANSTYWYQIVPFSDESATGQVQSGPPSNSASVTTVPNVTDYVLQGTVTFTPPVNNEIGSSSATSSFVLASGTKYLLVVSGTFALANVSSGSNTYSADAGYWYSDANPQNNGDVLGTSSSGDTAFGLGVSGVSPSGTGGAFWGIVNTGGHSYSEVVTGEGQVLTLTYSDADHSTNTYTGTAGLLQVQIYVSHAAEPSVAPPSGSSSVLRIVSPNSNNEVINSNTPVDIIADNPNGTAVPWTLALVSASSGVVFSLANGDGSFGQGPSAAVPVATIEPGLYPNGLYALELISSGTVEDTRPLDIETLVKSGEFALPVTDATISLPTGNTLDVTRVYNSAQSYQEGDLGYGWSLNLLDTQLTTTARPDTIGTISGATVLQPGDLISVTVPDGGQHVFEFEPTPTDLSASFDADVPTNIYYSSQFIAVDGSGATLALTNGERFNFGIGDSAVPLIYDPLDNEYIVYDEFGNGVPFNPANPSLGLDYQLTTKDGESYIINAATGQIQSSTDANGNAINYTVNQTTGTTLGTITLTTDGETLLTIATNTVTSGANTYSQINSITVPGQTPLHYNYDGSDNLKSAVDQAGDTRSYVYQNTSIGHDLTALTNAQGQTVLQAQYNSSSGELDALVNASGVTVPVASSGFDGAAGSQTVVDAEGNITQYIYDAFGNVTRQIQTEMNASGTVSGYTVTVTGFAYAVAPISGALGNLQAPLVASITHYAPFEISGQDAQGLRYTQQTSSETSQTTFDVSNDAGQGRVASTSQLTNSNGTLQTFQTTIYGGYTAVGSVNGIQLVKPETVTTEIQTPNGTGYTVSIQSMAFTTYDSNGNVVYSLNALATETSPGSGYYTLTQGTSNTYTSAGGNLPAGLLQETEAVLATVQLNDDGTIRTVNGTVLSVQTANTYYTSSDSSVVGAAYGALKTTTNAVGQTTFFAYTPSGQTVLDYTYKTWSGGSGWVGTTSYYDSAGRLTDTYQGTYSGSSSIVYATTNTAGNIVVNTSSGHDTLVGTLVHTQHDDYNSLSQLADTVDQYGATTTHTYDISGQTIQTQYPNGTETQTVYDADGRAIWATNPFVPSGTLPIVATNTIYNDLGQVQETDVYEDVTVTFATTGSGASAVYSTAIGSTGTLVSSNSQWYDSQGRVIETESPGGLRTGTMYYPNGQVEYTGPLNASAPDGGGDVNGVAKDAYSLGDYAFATTYLYAQVNTTSGNPMEGHLYDAVIDALGHETETYQDMLGRTIRTVYPNGSFTETLYSYGKAPVATDAEGDTLFSPTGTLGLVNGQTETVQIAQRKTTDAVVATYDLYDNSGNLTEVWQPGVVDASTTITTDVMPHWQYEYDASGNETVQIDPYGNKTTFTYDQFGDELTRKLPGGQTETFTYDQFQREATHTDFDGNVSTYTYYNSGVNAGMLEDVVYGAASGSGKTAQTVTYTYDNFGNELTVADASGTTTYTYDVFGNQTQAATPEGTINYVFDDATGNEIETWTGASYGSATTDEQYGYNTLGQLVTATATKIDGSSVDLVTSYTYDVVGNMHSESLPNGIITTYSYDSQNRLTGLTDKLAGTLVFSETNTYYDNGLKDSVLDHFGPGNLSFTITTYTYDALNRLTGETLTGYMASTSNYTDAYSYDLDSDQIAKVDSNIGTTTYTYNSNNEMLTQNVAGAVVTFVYDNNGSQITATTGSSVTTYTYDVRNKMIGDEANGATVATLTYNDDGDRVQETAAGTTTFYLTDTNNPTGYDQPIEQWTSTTNTRSTATLEETYIISDRVLGQANTGGTLTYLLTDSHDSTRLLTDASGSVIGTINYDVFGAVISSSGYTLTDFQFAGDEVADAATGLNLVGDGVRIRQPGEEDFDERDVFGYSNNLNPITLNAEIYGDGDPANNRDPNGHYSSAGQAAAAGIAAGLAAGGYGAASEVYAIVGSVIEDAEVYEDEVTELAVDTGNAASDEIESDLGELEHTADNFRENLENLTGRQPSFENEFEELQAHHVFPQEFDVNFEEAGVDIHDPTYGQWVDDDHGQYASEYNEYWQEFFDDHEVAGTKPTVQEIMDYGTYVMNEVYGLDPLYE